MTTLTRLLPLTALLLGSALATTLPERDQHVQAVLGTLKLRTVPCAADVAVTRVTLFDTLCVATSLAPKDFAAQWSQAARQTARPARETFAWTIGTLTTGAFTLPDGDPYVVQLHPKLGQAVITWTHPVPGSRSVPPRLPRQPDSMDVPGAVLPAVLHAGAQSTRTGPLTGPISTARDLFHIRGPVKRVTLARKDLTVKGKEVTESAAGASEVTFDPQGRTLTMTIFTPDGSRLMHVTNRYTGPLLAMQTTEQLGTVLTRTVYEAVNGAVTVIREYDGTGALRSTARLTPYPNGYKQTTLRKDGTVIGVQYVLQDGQGRPVRSESVYNGDWAVTTRTYDGEFVRFMGMTAYASTFTGAVLPDGRRDFTTSPLDRDESVPTVTKDEQPDEYGNPTVSREYEEVTRAGTTTLKPKGITYATYEYH